MTLQFALNAVVTAGLPLFLLSFVLVAWALYRGRLEGMTVSELQGSIEALGKAQKKRKRRDEMDPALNKWLRFGGGFYGLVALYTWLLIEWEDLANFFRGFWHVAFSLDPGGLIRLAIDLFVESLMNFVVAIAWPAYWLQKSRDAWILLFVAYAGYWLGIKAAQYAWREGWVTKVIERVSEIVR